MEDTNVELRKYRCASNLLMRLRFIFCCLYVVSFNHIHAQNSDKAVEFSSLISEESMKHNLSIFASDSFLGRDTGKEGQKLAADFLINQYKSLEIGYPPQQNGYEQFFTVIESQPSGFLTINNQLLSFDSSFFYFGAKRKQKIQQLPLYSLSKNSSKISDSCVAVCYVDNLNLRDEIAKIKLKLPINAKALVLITSNYSQLSTYFEHYIHDASMYLKEDEQQNEFPIIIVNSQSLSNAFLNKVKSNKKTKNVGLLSCELNAENKELTSSNVLAFIPGQDELLKEEVIVISAHYDHIGVKNGEIYNGADDDGTGSVALLEIAKALKQATLAGYGLKRSVLFLHVSGEEKGLLGSSYYTNHPVLPLAQTVTDLNIDMIGRNDAEHPLDTNYVYIIGSSMLSNDLHQANEQANKWTKLKLDYRYNLLSDPNQFYYRSDHYNFAKNNIPVIFYFSGIHEDYHKPTDDVEKIIFSKVKRISQLVFHTMWNIGNMALRPQLTK